jgi:hypothetical protein
LTCRIVLSVSFFDHRIGSNAEQATGSVPTEAVVVAQPGRIASGVSSSASRIARFANEIEGICGGLRNGFGPASALRLTFARHFKDDDNELEER